MSPIVGLALWSEKDLFNLTSAAAASLSAGVVPSTTFGSRSLWATEVLRLPLPAASTPVAAPETFCSAPEVLRDADIEGCFAEDLAVAGLGVSDICENLRLDMLCLRRAPSGFLQVIPLSCRVMLVGHP